MNRCEHCGQVVDATVTLGDKVGAILRSMNLGPRTLGQLAFAVHGRDTAGNRRKVAWLIKSSLRDVLEPVDGKGTWQLVNAAQHPEAAE